MCKCTFKAESQGAHLNVHFKLGFPSPSKGGSSSHLSLARGVNVFESSLEPVAPLWVCLKVYLGSVQGSDDSLGDGACHGSRSQRD